MSSNPSKNKRQAGFSLAETVIALLIFSLAASVLLPNALSSAQRISKDAQAVGEELELHNAIAAHLLGLEEADEDNGLRIVSKTQVKEGAPVHLHFYEIEQNGQARSLAAQIEPPS